MKEVKVVAVSGGFDPVHKGHVQMIEEASTHGPVMVIINSDAWLMRKKGYVFMKWEERAEILRSIVGVEEVLPAKDYDDTVCDSLSDIYEVIGLDYFANGGDRKQENTPEMQVCKSLGIEMVWNCGGGKIQSSSDLVKNTKK